MITGPGIPAVRLRVAGPDDVPWLVRTESAGTTPRYLGVLGTEYHEAGLRDPDVEQLLGTCGGERIGFVVVAGLSGDDGSFELRRVVVDPAYRGRGLGRSLVETVIGHLAATRRARRVWLDVRPENTVARTLYAGLGFVRFGSVPDPVDPGGHLLLMQRPAVVA